MNCFDSLGRLGCGYGLGRVNHGLVFSIPIIFQAKKIPNIVTLSAPDCHGTEHGDGVNVNLTL